MKHTLTTQEPSLVQNPFPPPQTDWFDEARLGLFIHWGPYSVAGRGEWVMNRECIPFEEYRDQYACNFRTEKYDPEQWARIAMDAGTKYVVISTRHHDGFALWDTRTTDFNAVQIGPKRDLIRPFVETMRRYGLKVGFYFSVADWSHPDYPPYERDWPEAWADEAARMRFVNHYHAQLQELMTGYGKIDLLWYDGCFPQPLDGDAINTKIKQWQPGILINERNGAPSDFAICEKTLSPKDGRWESCFSLNDTWGYNPGATEWRTPKQLIMMMLETAKNAGNLLLNVGPMPCGTIPPPAVERLHALGTWLRKNGEFLPNSSRSPFTWNNSSLVTTRGDCVYLHIVRYPGDKYCFADLVNPVLRVTQLDTGKELAFRQDGDRLFITGYSNPGSDTVLTLKIEVQGTPETCRKQQSFWIVD